MIGERVGNYQITDRLGAGGMGVVYLAVHTMIGRKAAIKLLKPEYCHDEEILGRFFNEARSAATIRHPGLVDVFDFGHHAGGGAYIAMEFLEGESLAARLKRDERIGLPFAIGVARQVAAAVGAAHARGIVHRDLKPDNVFLVPDVELASGLRAKVLDFGVAKLSAELAGQTPHTSTGSLLGTPLYMSPEQCRGAGAVDWRSDIYSLGCVLYELISGNPPFVLAGVGELISAHLNDVPLRLSQVSRGVPASLDKLVAAMLAKKPDDRPQTMEELSSLLARIERELGATSGASSVDPGTSLPGARAAVALSVDTTMGRSASEVVRPSRARKPLMYGVVGGALALVVAVIVIATMNREDRSRANDSPTGRAGAQPMGAPDAAAMKVTPLVPATSKVTITLTSDPAGAEVFRALDGVKLGTTPMTLSLDRAAGGSVTLVLKRTSFERQSVVVPVDKDATMNVKLVRRPNKTGSGGKSIGDGVLD